jgi:hypothetical protein
MIIAETLAIFAKLKNGRKTSVNGAPFDPMFYKNVDFDGMLKYLLTNRKLTAKMQKT